MDMIVMTPIAVTSVDWKKLFGPISEIICRPVSRGLDSKNMAGRGPAEFVSALGEFHTQNTDPIASQRNAGFLLKHVTISFFCSAPPDCIHELLLTGRVSVLESEYDSMVIVTANLEDWRTTIINLCSENQTKPMRLIGERVIQAFDDLGLTRLFETYSRRTSLQGGLILSAQK